MLGISELKLSPFLRVGLQSVAVLCSCCGWVMLGAELELAELWLGLLALCKEWGTSCTASCSSGEPCSYCS